MHLAITPDEEARRGVIAKVANCVLRITSDAGERHPAAYLTRAPRAGIYCFVAKGQTAFNCAYVIDHPALFHKVNPTRDNGLTNLTAFSLTPVPIPSEYFDEAERDHRMGRLSAEVYAALCRGMRWRVVLSGI